MIIDLDKLVFAIVVSIVTGFTCFHYGVANGRHQCSAEMLGEKLQSTHEANGELTCVYVTNLYARSYRKEKVKM